MSDAHALIEVSTLKRKHTKFHILKPLLFFLRQSRLILLGFFLL